MEEPQSVRVIEMSVLEIFLTCVVLIGSDNPTNAG